MTVAGFIATLDSTAGMSVKVLVTVEPYIAVNVQSVRAATAVVVIEKVTELAAAGTSTVAGTLAFAESLYKVTRVPPLGAMPLSVTVPVQLLPPYVILGVALIDVTIIGTTVSVAVWLTPPNVAEIVAVLVAVTVVVVTGKVADDAFAATETVAGTVTPEPVQVRDTVVAACTGAVKVTVACEVEPPATVEGFNATDWTDTGTIANGVCAVTPPQLAVMFALT
jgi:hypothetical protein